MPDADQRTDLIPRDIADALADSAYLAGLQAGWRMGLAEDARRFERACASRAGYLAPITAALRERAS